MGKLVWPMKARVQTCCITRRFGPAELNFLYLNARDADASPQMLRAFVRNVGLAPDSYAILDGKPAALTNTRANPIPRTYVFDRAGDPEAVIIGYKPLALDRVAGLISP